MAFDDELLDEVREALRHVRNPLNQKVRTFDTDQLYAAARAVEFLRGCRVTGVDAQVTEVDGEDGAEPTWYYKCRLRGTMEGRRAGRTLVIGAFDPMAQLLRKEGDFGALPPPATALRPLVPREQWDALKEQLADFGARFERDSAGTLQARVAEVRDRIFQKDRERLVLDMARLQRKGWKKGDVDGCWDEALVKGVMEA